VFKGPSAPLTSVARGGAGNFVIAAGCWDKNIWTWDAKTKEPALKLSGHSDFVKAVVTTTVAGKDVLISGGADKKIMVWDLATGTRLHVLQDQITPMGAIQDLIVDPVSAASDEVVVVSASSDPNIRRWRIRLDSAEQISEPSQDGKPAQSTILAHETTVYKLFFDMEDEEEADLWTASGDGTAKQLSRAKGHAVEDTITHGDHVRAIAVTSQWIITAGRDEDIKIWDRSTGKLAYTLDGHYDEVTALVVTRSSSGQGDRLISASLDGTIRSWGLSKKDLDKFADEQAERAESTTNGAQEKKEGEGLMSAEEEAELAALMQEDED
jgi:WD40 repeat protein